ncbi:heme o synthase [Quadrisphaera sp. DSM 44207]|uniref:heme o synthase n=1 Tax=Quadrisphaera sp. DSM 44207 TaxID=1881057 RepID=UPI000880F706|nr:heme o synthase [Quadrisphaera sp. DSM 44207]SDQ44109.1 protoheme IX farnesyltransferase [Quadrisphaera sp. DSM 44207]
MTAVEHVAPSPARWTTGQRLLGFVALTKPRIIELLLMTTVPTMMLADRGLPPLGLLGATLVGGTLAAASANALNCYLDRDIDMRMHRTGRRPLVTGVVRPGEALAFGLGLGVVAVAWLALVVNGLSALLAGLAIAFYVLVYTLGLKRRTRQNIVWGGAAGCMPVLIGWSAVTGSLSWTPWVLFAVIFLWTPPHYWPLSIKYRDDYAEVGVPMLPVVATPTAVGRQVVAYTWATVAATLLLVPVAGTGPVYAGAAVLLGAWFVAEAHGLLRRARRVASADEVRAMRLFHVSISYLTLLFLALAVDAVLPHRLL